MASTAMRRSPAAARMESVRSHNKVSGRPCPRASSSARSSGSPVSCSTSSPSGATNRAAFEGTVGTETRSAPKTKPASTSRTMRCRNLRRPSRPRQSPCRIARNRLMNPAGAARRSWSDLFLDPGSLARQITQVVQLRTPDATAAFDGDVADRRAVGLEDALHALAMRNLAHGERGVQSAIADGNHDALVRLHALAIAFHDLHLHDHRVA